VTALDAATPAPTTPPPAITVPAATAANKPSASPANTKPATPAVASGKTPAATTAAASATSDKPAPPSPAAAGRGYAVQVVAFRGEDQALALRNKLRAAGFTAFSEKVQAESGTMYRVRIGPEADRDAADRLRDQLSTKMKLSGVVVAYP
jgi:cell division septation protein DedD